MVRWRLPQERRHELLIANRRFSPGCFQNRWSTLTLSAQIPWIQAGVPALVLAPMEGVMDAAMRALLSELGGFTFCVAEFLRISKAVPGAKVFQRHVPELMRGGATAAGLPVQVQLLGGDPD